MMDTARSEVVARNVCLVHGHRIGVLQQEHSTDITLCMACGATLAEIRGEGDPVTKQQPQVPKD